MKPPTPSQEIELKLALPGSDPSQLRAQLGRLAPLARRKPVQQPLHNIYFDTPDQALRQQRVALRLRRVGPPAQARWLQTLKTAGLDNSALSRRGEWESPVREACLSATALAASPWSEIDPDGRLLARLRPCFVTDFERTVWLVRRRDGSVVEVALDIGQLLADECQAPICELELELKAGTPAALFALAHEIARSIAVLPTHQSKAERGFLLAQGALAQPIRAHAPVLSPTLSLHALVPTVLREMLTQFTSNLNLLRSSDDAEVVHQARVGWRRWKTGLRLFRKLLAGANMPSLDALRPLLSTLGELRNLDVACTDILPALAKSFVRKKPQRRQAWQTMMAALQHASQQQRQAVREALQHPGVGACLLQLTEWLENLDLRGVDSLADAAPALRLWAERRIERLQQRLDQSQQHATTPEQLHRVRILAKNLRYSTEALAALLPPKRARRCLRHATALQTGMGLQRDLMLAHALVERFDPDPEISAFLLDLVASEKR